MCLGEAYRDRSVHLTPPPSVTRLHLRAGASVVTPPPFSNELQLENGGGRVGVR